MKPTIADIQDEVIEEFALLGDDKESIIFYIMELGQKLPPFPEEEKIEENVVKGCQSKVWLITSVSENNLFFKADSNTEITKGLISLLIRILSGQPVDQVLTAELFFIEKIGMRNIIGSQRSNGFAAMIKQMKLYALAYKTKLA
jgi:cysteine desulfuration protein SufE